MRVQLVWSDGWIEFLDLPDRCPPPVVVVALMKPATSEWKDPPLPGPDEVVAERFLFELDGRGVYRQPAQGEGLAPWALYARAVRVLKPGVEVEILTASEPRAVVEFPPELHGAHWAGVWVTDFRRQRFLVDLRLVRPLPAPWEFPRRTECQTE
ncbi:MAG: hypothetical protein MUC88_00330 [Planctomycetes bacterium]|jgi:hypothetical protein|nr:hypothetical protein [Planctomycetota bacterium]